MTATGKWRNVFSDPELWALFFLNLWLLYSFYLNKIGPSTIIFIYYCQSVLIGVFHFIRLSVYPKKGGASDNSSSPAWFFALHYGGFHFFYLIFVAMLMAGMGEMPRIVFAGWVLLGFALNGVLSLLSLVKEDKQKDAVESGILFFLPYLRIVPMHLFIILGMRSIGDDNQVTFHDTFLIFLGLKTLSDVLMHILTNRTWRQRRPRVVGKYI